MSTIRTRFAPSPTGYLHLGGARTALFSWAFARHNNGVFVLRIEDTDLERSTPQAVQAILDGMKWLGLDHDEGPFYQTKRFDRYKEVIAQMLKDGTAYYCYSTPEEVEKMREDAKAKGLKPKYDGTWRPEPGKVLPPIPEGRKPVVRFKNPTEGSVSWNDMLKGPISIDNKELDDLIIARQDGSPTYNFCVVIDDWDMQITHVIRGDDHVNNTPRQINILKALNAPIPVYGHLPMILGPDGQKLSKRHGAVSVMQYDTDGYLSDAMINYLARLGWSHGDDEIFSREQIIEWFDGNHLSRSAAQWDPKKLNWVNAHYIKQLSDEALVAHVAPRIQALGGTTENVDLVAVLSLFKERAETLEQLAQEAMLFCAPFKAADEALLQQFITDDAKTIVADFMQAAEQLPEWSSEALSVVIKETLSKHGVKMPALGIPLRLLATGHKQTPAIDHVLAILGKDTVLNRLKAAL
ncbi:glutamate--tRNA ligase [Pelistega europaea]|uniref:Glutamate--tRNA ligase n=1 Tax=Pelistega europaea TaxID=106147 RepID=A0A7Y4LAC5_9BURK|nr:glutamate--tRNA ligase [Pelistega europaea]NOL49945.1 glutamate--tRNA ligase [Pelistega europaea]